MADISTKRVKLSQIVEDLNAGLTRWKKDDIGFGSLEKKYSLTMSEMIELLAHPKVKIVETKIPTFVIEDDLQDEPVTEVVNTTIQVSTEKVAESQQPKTTIVVKTEPVKENTKIEAFI